MITGFIGGAPSFRESFKEIDINEGDPGFGNIHLTSNFVNGGTVVDKPVLCWLEEAKRNFFTRHIPKIFNPSQTTTVTIQINDNMQVSGVIYSQQSKADVIIPLSNYACFNKYILVAHSTGAPISRRYITDSTPSDEFYYQNDIKKLVTMAGANAGCNWAETSSLAELFAVNGYVGPLFAVAGGYCLATPGLQSIAGMLIVTGTSFMALLPTAQLIGFSGDIDDDLKAGSSYVNRDVSSIKPPSVDYATVVGTGYPVPGTGDMDILATSFSTTVGSVAGFWAQLWEPFAVSASIFGASLTDFLSLHSGWNDGDDVLTINEATGHRVGAWGQSDLTNQAIADAPSLTIAASHFDLAFWDSGYTMNGENLPGVENEHYNALLKQIDDAPIVTTVDNRVNGDGFEPNYAYRNIQNPLIHPKGSVSDYLIKYMGTNNVVNAQGMWIYNKDYINLENVFTCQDINGGTSDAHTRTTNNPDVGTTYFDQPYQLQICGTNNIGIKAINPGGNVTDNVSKTYYSVGIKSPQDGSAGTEFTESKVVWYVNKTTKNEWIPSFSNWNNTEYDVTYTPGAIIDGPYIQTSDDVKVLSDDPKVINQDVDFVIDTPNAKIKIKLRNNFSRTKYLEIRGNAIGNLASVLGNTYQGFYLKCTNVAVSGDIDTEAFVAPINIPNAISSGAPLNPELEWTRTYMTSGIENSFILDGSDKCERLAQ